MLFFAYDGSINGDWVSHYAVQLAAAHHDHRLTLIHVRNRLTTEASLTEKLQRMRRECERHGVEFIPQLLPPVSRHLHEAIRSVVPAGPEHYLVCGTRARGLRRGFLSGSIAEHLLDSGHCNVLAVRVVHPGLLGAPHRLLLPVVERPGGFRSGFPFLRLFYPLVSQLHLVLVAHVRHGRYRQLNPALAERLSTPGLAYCERIEQEIDAQLGLGAKILDTFVVVSDQIAGEILIAANKTLSQLIYIGASERTARERFFYGDPIEQVLRQAPCDVAVYRGIA
jgi:nucleotide-binding universal stress UspA family protein